MANIKSIGGNPIVLGLDGLSDEVTHGYNPSLSVGRADALTGADSTAQWTQRVTAGSGAAIVRSVQGASVVWNQRIMPNVRSVTSKGVTYTMTSDGKVTLDGTATGAETFTTSLAFSVVSGHKYLFSGADTSQAVYWTTNGIGSGLTSESIYTASTDIPSTTASIVVAATYTGTYECYPMLFDLTAMFGAGNEPATVAEFKAMYPENYYPYSAPTLKPVQIAGMQSVGRNMLDPSTLEATGYYQVNGDAVTVLASDSRGWANIAACATLDAGTYIFSRSNASGSLEIRGESGTLQWVASGTYITTFVVTRRTAIKLKVGVSASSYPFTTTLQLERGTVATAYKPYMTDSVEWTAKTLHAAGSVADMLYSDHVDIRVGVVDLGTLNWFVAENSNVEFRATRSANPDVPMWVGTVGNVVSNCKCAEYESLSPNAVYLGANRGIAIAGDNYISVGDSTYTTAADFKAAMSGVMLFYELATPTTTPISPALPMTYRVEQGGSESIIVPEGEISAAPVLTVAEGESAADVVMDALACIATPDGPVATSSHAVNTYLTMGGKLYKVTSAIAVGETIKSGTNVTETTVMAELIARTA